MGRLRWSSSRSPAEKFGHFGEYADAPDAVGSVLQMPCALCAKRHMTASVSAHTSKTLSSIRTYKRATLLLYSMILATTLNAGIRLSEGLA
jgi:hypothetical protein